MGDLYLRFRYCKYNPVMEALLTNKLMVIKNPTDEVARHVTTILSYTDKSIQYLIKRKLYQPMFKYSEEYKQLQAQANGEMFKWLPGGHLAMSSGFAYLADTFNLTKIDQRFDTGAKIAYPWIKKPFDPRDYQDEAINLMENNYRGLINFATGLGKTLTAIHAIRRIGRRTLIVVPSESIAMQFIDELKKAFGDKRVELFSGKRKKTADITVGIAASVVRAIDTFKNLDLGLIIFDEVHHIAANTFFDVARGLGHVGRMFGLTATDFRSDGKDIMIKAGCGDVLICRDLIWGIKHKWLAEPEFVITKVRTSGKNFFNDKLKNYREHVLNSDEMNDAIRSDIRRAIQNGESVLVLVDQVSHGEMLAKEFNLPFATGTDNKSQDYVDQLNDGKIPGLIGTDGKVGEGTDTKRVDVLIMANFAAGKGPIYQCLGRGTRKYGNKTHVRVHDYVAEGSDMLKRHSDTRIAIYKTISKNIQFK